MRLRNLKTHLSRKENKKRKQEKNWIKFRNPEKVIKETQTAIIRIIRTIKQIVTKKRIRQMPMKIN